MYLLRTGRDRSERRTVYIFYILDTQPSLCPLWSDNSVVRWGLTVGGVSVSVVVGQWAVSLCPLGSDSGWCPCVRCGRTVGGVPVSVGV